MFGPICDVAKRAASRYFSSVYKVSGAATPRFARRRSVALFVGRSRAGFGLALATLQGCAELNRPTFPGDAKSNDQTAPSIEFTTPAPGDTIVEGGTPVGITLTVRDSSGIKKIQVAVTGATAFNLADQFPGDSMRGILFSIPTSKSRLGRVVVQVDATDAFDNGSTKSFAFVVR